MAKGCIDCGVGVWYGNTSGLCTTCNRARTLYKDGKIPPSKPTLKVFQITIYKQRKYSELVMDSIIVLASTEEMASALAFSQFGYVQRVKDHNYHIWEIKGPFIEGSILYRTPQ